MSCLGPQTYLYSFRLHQRKEHFFVVSSPNFLKATKVVVTLLCPSRLLQVTCLSSFQKLAQDQNLQQTCKQLKRRGHDVFIRLVVTCYIVHVQLTDLQTHYNYQHIYKSMQIHYLRARAILVYLKWEDRQGSCAISLVPSRIQTE